MKKICIILLFAMPIAVFASGFCFDTQAEAEPFSELYYNHCIQVLEGTPEVMITYRTYGDDIDKYCVIAYCADKCRASYKKYITEHCCQLKKAPRSISDFQCIKPTDFSPGYISPNLNLSGGVERCTDQFQSCNFEEEEEEEEDDDNDSSSSNDDSVSSSSEEEGSSSSSDDDGDSSSSEEASSSSSDDYGSSPRCFASYVDAQDDYNELYRTCIIDDGGASSYRVEFTEKGWCVLGGCGADKNYEEGYICRATSYEIEYVMQQAISDCNPNENNYSTAFFGMLNEPYCLLGECKYPDCDINEPISTCRATAGELTDTMNDLIDNCRKGNPENGYSYNIKYFENNPPESLFCITGQCNPAESSSSSFSSSSYNFFSKSTYCRWHCFDHPPSVSPGMVFSRGDVALVVANIGVGNYPVFVLSDVLPVSSSYSQNCISLLANNSQNRENLESFCSQHALPLVYPDLFSSNSVVSSSSFVSSSSVFSSSSYNSSSNSDEKSSSSSDNDKFSSSSYENSSSSRVAYSSSSQTTAAKPNEPGPNAVYTVNDCFSSGLDNMEPGKCYGLNPDRGTQHGWINSNAQDRWWWEERACDCSALVESITPGGCKHNVRSINAVYTANDCFSSGLDNMEPSKCYSLNPSRGTQYGWISNDAQDRWWWIEVLCGGNVFQKRGAYENFSTEENDFNYIWRNESKSLYDAKGRKTQARPETRRFLFLPKKTQ